jgi:hypothetical protein
MDTETEKDDLVVEIIRYESGEMSNEQAVKFFQKLIDSGLAWKLQGHYGRAAESLIEQGLCTRKLR